MWIFEAFIATSRARGWIITSNGVRMIGTKGGQVVLFHTWQVVEGKGSRIEVQGAYLFDRLDWFDWFYWLSWLANGIGHRASG
jgi:hypothetical protein